MDIQALITANPDIVILEDLKPAIFERWAAYVDARPKTIETYSRAIKQFAKWLAERGITKPQREDIIAYREHLRQDHKPATVQGYLTAVKLFFRWTSQEGIYPNVADKVKGMKLEKKHKKGYLTQGQVGELLESIDRSTISGKRDYAILSLMVTTGLRTISVARANIEDIGLEAGNMVLFYQGKDRDERAEYVNLVPQVEAAIREYLKARGEISGSAPLFASAAHRNYGERMTTRSISRIAKEHFISIGMDSDRITAHSLRHTAGTLNLLGGGTLEETQQMLAHRDIGTTMIYVHALKRENNKSEYRIANMIFNQ